jgi:hypothetical protein
MPSQENEDQIAQVKAAIAGRRRLQKQLAELESQAHPPEQQRKLLTILFTDVVGSTPLSRQLDPEELLDFMDPGPQAPGCTGRSPRRARHPLPGRRLQGHFWPARRPRERPRDGGPGRAGHPGASREIAQELERERGILELPGPGGHQHRAGGSAAG